eukprot:CAMPEP_0118637032 /NCGR_PEP_ID=MMETSP0785-20121206/2940_1 /TAXON_ID=91992 /ORGANISM="Bolidomonas pacifica, Strain CCMP 1866" /LENGTH=1568 /DNA_ID=CAMNT_0006528199 /DNA_START=812 /DNA_END=5518 /DNA_ORIENTATION=-
MYGEDVMSRSGSSSSSSSSSSSVNVGKGPSPSPHVYDVSHSSYGNMSSTGESQSILISGESGSGKTVTARHVLSHLTFMQRKRNGEGSRAEQIARVIEASGGILESFGNCRTERNDNSSRFGKLVNVIFEDGCMVGGTVETYLLEKNRIIRAKDTERTFNVMYELKEGGYEGMAGDDFKCMRGAFGRRDDVKDSDMYERMTGAFDEVGFGKDEVEDIFRATASVAWMSNVEVEDVEGEGKVGGREVRKVCELLGIQEERFRACTEERVIKANGEEFVKKLNALQVRGAIEGLMKAVYGCVFVDIVWNVNRLLDEMGRCANGGESITGRGGIPPSKSSVQSQISVLDIFGFEKFENNGFEQLCINFCNESLQQQFNAFVFKEEQALYNSEGILWRDIQFKDNEEVLDFIWGRPIGLLAVLDEACLLRSTTDQTFCSQIYKLHPSHPRMHASSRSKAKLAFTIVHYAGEVEYCAKGFVEKNKDELPREAVELLGSSSSKYIKVLQGRMRTYFGEHRQRANSIANKSVGSQFAAQLRKLNETISLTRPHYIRCLKPNAGLTPDNFNGPLVAEQLGAGGVLEAVKVSRLGYANRFACAEFVKRYGCLVKPTNVGDPKEKARMLVFDIINNSAEVPCKGMENEHLEEFGYQVGRTLVFLKREAFEDVETRLEAKLEQASVTLQKHARGSQQRKKYRKALFVILRIQCALRRKVAAARVRIIRNNKAATVLQASIRTHQCIARYRITLRLAATVQRVLRGRKERKLFMVVLRASKAIKLQSFYRSSSRRKTFNALRSAVVALQCSRRRKDAKVILKGLRAEARSVQAIKKERDALKLEALRMKEELDKARDLLQKEQEAARKAIEAAASASKERPAIAVAPVPVPIPTSSQPSQPSPPQQPSQHPDGMPPPETNLPTSPITLGLPTPVQKALSEKDREIMELKREMERLRAASRPSTPKGRASPPPPHVIATPSTPAFATPDEKLLEEAEILRKKNMELERQMERLTTTPSKEGKEELPFHSPSPMMMDRNPVSTPIQSYYVSAAKSKNQSALHFAVLQHDEDAVRSMLDQEIPASIASTSPLDVNSTNTDMRSALHLASINGSAIIVEMLLENFAVANAQDRNGDTSLHLTTSLNVAKLLLQKGNGNPNIPNNNGFSALHCAAKRGETEIAEELLKHGADCNAVCDKNWRSPVYDVAIQGNLELLKILVSHKGKDLALNLQDKYGYTPLHHVASLSKPNSVSLASVMLNASADPNVQDKHGFTPLHLLCNSKAARKGAGYELLELMLEQGADPCLQARDGCCPLHLALYHKDYESAVLLLQHGGSLTLPWRFPRRSESLKQWWVDEQKSPNRAGRMVIPLDIIGNDHRLLHAMLTSITRPQRWVDDSSRDQCMQCSAVFSFSVRHHHCRHCGRLVCNNCSIGTLSAGYFPPLIQSKLLSHDGVDDIGTIDKPHRVCFVCEQILEQRRKLMSPERSHQRAPNNLGGSSSTIEEEYDDEDEDEEDVSGTRGSFVGGMRKSLGTRFSNFVNRGGKGNNKEAKEVKAEQRRMQKESRQGLLNYEDYDDEEATKRPSL